MKIDLVITELDVGGAEQCLTNLAVYLHQHSHSVRVIALGPPPSADRNRLLKTLQSEGIDTHFLEARRAWQSPRMFAKMRQLIVQSRPDLVQSFLFHANLFSALAYAPWKIPLVGGIRVVDPRRSRAFLDRAAAMRMRYVVCVSQSVADVCANRANIPRDKLIVIQNGVPIARCPSDENRPEGIAPDRTGKSCSFAQQQLGLPADTPCLLFVGRIDFQKGADVLLERADRILRALPAHNIILVGDGPLKVNAQSHASRCEHENRIHFAGRRDDVLKWMKSSELLLLPTRFEGMPNVVLEAMSCGLPIVSTRAEGVLELLGESASDQTVAVNDWDTWTKKVIQLASDRDRRDRLSKENFERCRTQFNLTDKLQQYEQLYRNVLEP
jgi:glycosyltransferase involved in cell wall biosynthesis